jgi:hypothetical protein
MPCGFGEDHGVAAQLLTCGCKRYAKLTEAYVKATSSQLGMAQIRKRYARSRLRPFSC